jgi:signal transduction histidine kinase
MPDIDAPICFLEERPGLWPHGGVDKELPDSVRRCLRAGTACAFTDPVLALDHAEQAVALARTESSSSVLARTLYLAGVLSQQAGDPVGAYSMCLEAQPLLERMDERWRATMVLLLRSQCCLSVDEHERARTLVAEAMHRFENLSDTSALAACWHITAIAHRMGGDLASAIDAIELAAATLAADLDSGQQRSIAFEHAQLRLQLGAQWAQTGDTERALREYERAWRALPPLESLAINHWTQQAARQLETIVCVSRACGRLDDTRRALIRLMEWARLWRSPRERAMAWYALAEWRRQQGLRPTAIINTRRAIRLFALLPVGQRLPQAQRTLADMLEAEGDLPGAYAARSTAARTEAEQRRYTIARRAELLMLDRDAEQELRRSEQTLAYAQRLSGVGHLVASVNHELTLPMASIRMLAETAVALIEQGDTAEARASVRSMHRISARLVDVTSKLAAFPAQAANPAQSVSLRFAVDEALATLSSRLAQTPCALDVQVPDVRVKAQEGQLVRVIVNLVNNALDVCAGVPSPRISFSCSLTPQKVVLSICDNGPGLSEAARARLFQPFFSTKPAGQGLGLGLAMSRQVMHEMGGDLNGYDASGGGAQFDVVLPCDDAAAAPAPGT